MRYVKTALTWYLAKIRLSQRLQNYLNSIRQQERFKMSGNIKKAFILLVVFLTAAFSLSHAKPKPEETYIIEGTVTDFYGVPWKNAVIKLKSLGETYAAEKFRIEREVQTDSNGKYRFTELPDDAYELTLLRTGSLSLEEVKNTGILFGEKVTKVDFGVEIGTTTECLYFVTGRVTDTTGKPVSNAKISVMNAFNQRRILSKTTDRNGDYRITVCGLGQYIVFANTPKYMVQTTNITFEAFIDHQKFVDFKLEPLSQKRLEWRKSS